MEPGAGSTIGIVAERGSVDEGVVLAARTIGALCMRAESIMHFFSSDSEDTTTCLLRYSDDLAVAQSWDLRVRPLCDREELRRRWRLRHGLLLWYALWYTESGEVVDRKRYEGSVTTTT